MGSAALLVNASSVGMGPHDDETPVSRRWLKPEMAVFDAVYYPQETRLLREAREAGARAIGGLDMLVGQAEIAFELWTDRPVPAGVMKEAVV